MMRRLNACTWSDTHDCDVPSHDDDHGDGSQPGTLGGLTGVRASDDVPKETEHPDTEPRSHPRVLFRPLHAMVVMLILACALCMSLTMLIRQSMNYQQMPSQAYAEHAPSSAAAKPKASGEGAVVPRNGTSRESGRSKAEDQVDAPSGSAMQSPSSTDTRSRAAALININTATLQELDALPGIGPVMAQRILDHRRSIGRFTDVDQLLDVTGIGMKTLDKLRSKVTVS